MKKILFLSLLMFFFVIPNAYAICSYCNSNNYETADTVCACPNWEECKDIYYKSTAYVADTGQSGTDYCYDNNTVAEYYINCKYLPLGFTDSLEKEFIDCQPDEACIDGKCVYTGCGGSKTSYTAKGTYNVCTLAEYIDASGSCLPTGVNYETGYEPEGNEVRLIDTNGKTLQIKTISICDLYPLISVVYGTHTLIQGNCYTSPDPLSSIETICWEEKSTLDNFFDIVNIDWKVPITTTSTTSSTSSTSTSTTSTSTSTSTSTITSTSTSTTTSTTSSSTTTSTSSTSTSTSSTTTSTSTSSSTTTTIPTTSTTTTSSSTSTTITSSSTSSTSTSTSSTTTSISTTSTSSTSTTSTTTTSSSTSTSTTTVKTTSSSTSSTTSTSIKTTSSTTIKTTTTSSIKTTSSTVKTTTSTTTTVCGVKQCGIRTIHGICLAWRFVPCQQTTSTTTSITSSTVKTTVTTTTSIGECEQKGESCTSNSQCCSNSCTRKCIEKFGAACSKYAFTCN